MGDIMCGDFWKTYEPDKLSLRIQAIQDFHAKLPPSFQAYVEALQWLEYQVPTWIDRSDGIQVTKRLVLVEPYLGYSANMILMGNHLVRFRLQPYKYHNQEGEQDNGYGEAHLIYEWPTAGINKSLGKATLRRLTVNPQGVWVIQPLPKHSWLVPDPGEPETPVLLTRETFRDLLASMIGEI